MQSKVMNTSVRPKWWLLFITAFRVLSHYQSLLPANPCKKKLSHSKCGRRGKKDSMGQGGEDVHALWLNAALLAPKLPEAKKHIYQLMEAAHMGSSAGLAPAEQGAVQVLVCWMTFTESLYLLRFPISCDHQCWWLQPLSSRALRSTNSNYCTK